MKSVINILEGIASLFTKVFQYIKSYEPVDINKYFITECKNMMWKLSQFGKTKRIF